MALHAGIRRRIPAWKGKDRAIRFILPREDLSSFWEPRTAAKGISVCILNISGFFLSIQDNFIAT
jgi:hypothetical protein